MFTSACGVIESLKGGEVGGGSKVALASGMILTEEDRNGLGNVERQRHDVAAIVLYL